MIYLTAVGLPPGGRSTLHICTQTIHRIAQSTQTMHRTTQFTNYEKCDVSYTIILQILYFPQQKCVVQIKMLVPKGIAKCSSHSIGLQEKLSYFDISEQRVSRVNLHLSNAI
jgi:hypothetical protein